MDVDIRTHLDLFDLDDLLLFASFGSFFLRLIFEFAKIKNFANRRLGSRRNLDEIKARIACLL
jgi:hypothetical protein